MDRNRVWRTVAALAFVAVVLAGCDDGSTPESPSTTTEASTMVPTDPPSSLVSPTTEPSAAPSGPVTERVQAAIDDLAERQGLDAAQIVPGPLEQVTWSDSSIGCPSADQSYMQSLIPGARVILTVEGTEYAYHASGDEPLFYCSTPTPPTDTGDITR